VKHEDVKHEEHGDDVPSFHDWVRQVPAEIREDSLWLVEAYRLSLYLGDLGWHDANAILQDRRMFEIADQLRRATSKISSSIAEGYSRNTGKGRSTYYEYAAGSAASPAIGTTNPATLSPRPSSNTASPCAPKLSASPSP